jgi:hypothetical protein
MKYRKTFREALNDVDKKGKPEAKPETDSKDENPVEDKDETIKKLELEIATLKAQADLLIAPTPHPDTGEVPLRTGVAAALLDKNGPKPKVDKESNRKKLKMSLGKTKITIDPDVNLGQISGGTKVNTGNLH